VAARWVGPHLECLRQAAVLHVVVGVLLLERVLDARKVVAVRRPAVLQPVLGLCKFVALRLPAIDQGPVLQCVLSSSTCRIRCR
jgi:hypothetical protein